MKLADPALLRNLCLVDGKWVGEGIDEIRNPATGALVARVPRFGFDETVRAIEAASKAFAPWAKKLPKQRAAILRRWFDLIVANREDLALIMTSEQGKPLAEARGEIDYAAGFVEFFGEEAKRVYGEINPTFRADSRILVLKQPIGVIAAITPWNFPAAMITRKVAPALAVGCTAVVKPAPETPLTALALAELAVRAGFPDGVLNMLTGDAPAIGKAMCEHPAVRFVGFTGSTEVGKLLMRQAAGTVKKVGLELGGNAPFIVFDDAEVDAAVEGAIASKFRNMGQTCVCANRIYAQEGIYEAFVARLTEAVARLKVGGGTEPGVNQGPLINEEAVEKVEAHIADALAKGARATIGGKRHALGRTFFEPTVLSGLDASMRIAREETFGPVAPVFRFEDEADAIRLANDTQYGLAAYFYARDLGRVWRVAEALEYGMVGVNSGAISTELAPFGGVKESGLGREGSRHGAEEFVEIKYMLMSGLDR
ncbi:MAG TPA: NAD-dependent succinate-semialdehyde dehydrogenase [Roseiarcus sp.]|nr:NAD-dependent succinate-semialdehyde dehydrogenase [Roseiarcus sp.]